MTSHSIWNGYLTSIVHLTLAGALFAQDDNIQKRLEEKLEKSGSRVHVEFKDGLKFRTEDGTFDAHIGGRLLTHFRYVQDRSEGAGSRSSADSFFIRQARLEMSGTFTRDYEFKVQADFPTGSTSSTTGTLQDAFLGWKKYPELSLRMGQFKEPFSQEETTTTRFIDFVERSDPNRLTPARDIGFMLYGKLFENFLEYEVGVFNGGGRAVVDGNDEKDLAFRLRVHALKGLRLGIASTIGDVDSASFNGLDFTTTELAITMLDATAGSIDGQRTRIGAELSWIHGPVGLRAEWMQRTDEVDIGTSEDEEITLDGWYVAATWILTGEEKSLENRIVPTHPFDPAEGHWGAFELVVRIASVSIDEDIFDLGIASAATNSNEVLAFTVGVNCYLTRNFRVSPNVLFERYDDEVDFGNGLQEDSAWGGLVRFQIDF